MRKLFSIPCQRNPGLESLLLKLQQPTALGEQPTLARVASCDARWPQPTNASIRSTAKAWIVRVQQIDIGLEPQPPKQSVIHGDARSKKGLEVAQHELLSALHIGL